MLYIKRKEREELIYLIYNTYLTYKRGFLRRIIVYLKDHSPYLDSSLFIVNLKIQLELICWATTPLVVITLLTSCLPTHLAQ